MRERLIELITSADISLFGSDKPFAEVYADHLLESGVIVPPCKVGDTVYKLKENGSIVKGIVDNIHQNLVGKEKGRWIVTSWFDNYYADSKEAGFECGTHLYLAFSDFGKTVFLTKEKAEETLKGGVENDNR